jgi:chaperonin GroES
MTKVKKTAKLNLVPASGYLLIEPA